MTVYGQNIYPTDRLWSKVYPGANLRTLRSMFLNIWSHSIQYLRRKYLDNILAMPYWLCMVKMFARCKTKDPKEHFLKFWAKSI